MRFFSTSVIAALFIGLSSALSWSADAPSSSRREAQSALKPYGSLVGDWRGAGQVERGRAKGGWTEKANWAWKLSKDTAALEVSIPKGKYLRGGLLRPGPLPKSYLFEATLPNDLKRTFSGKETATAGKKSLVLTANDSGADGLRRITLTPLHDTRLLMLLEGQDADKDYTRFGEVGYTREGISFAVGESGPVCIVTEGRGTIPVSYKGKTYYVCCSGCKDLFNDNPEAILAEAAQREKEKKK